MARAIQLTPEFQTFFVENVVDGFRITLTATAAVDMPTAVFAYRAEPIQPGTGTARGIFSHVCSPSDLEEFPEGAPLVNSIPPWYRLASVDLAFRSRSQAQEAYEQIVRDVAALKASLDAMDGLVALEPLWIGPPPP